MAAQKAATLIFPMLGLKTGRHSHLYFQHMKQVWCIECVRNKNYIYPRNIHGGQQKGILVRPFKTVI